MDTSLTPIVSNWQSGRVCVAIVASKNWGWIWDGSSKDKELSHFGGKQAEKIKKGK